MADGQGVYNASALIHTGPGYLAGIVITASAGSPLCTIYDHDEASGTKIFEAYVPSTNPLIIFFSDRFAPRFAIGLYISLAANLTAVIWSRQL